MAAEERSARRRHPARAVDVERLLPAAVNRVEGRLEALVDTASLRPLRSAVGDGVVAGSGTVDGAPVFCWAQDGRLRGGSLGVAGGETIRRLLPLAGRARAPVGG